MTKSDKEGVWVRKNSANAKARRPPLPLYTLELCQEGLAGYEFARVAVTKHRGLGCFNKPRFIFSCATSTQHRARGGGDLSF